MPNNNNDGNSNSRQPAEQLEELAWKLFWAHFPKKAGRDYEQLILSDSRVISFAKVVAEAYHSTSLPVQQSHEREILNGIHHALGESELSDDTELPKMISDLRNDVKRLSDR